MSLIKKVVYNNFSVQNKLLRSFFSALGSIHVTQTIWYQEGLGLFLYLVAE